MNVHVRTGFRKRPSDAARWTRCAGSLRLTRDYPNESSAAADEGTMCHAVREQCLEFGFDAYDFIGFKMKINGVVWEFTDDLADAVQDGIDEIREFAGQMYVEQKVNTTKWVGHDENGKPQSGTLDCLVVGKKLSVLSDLKAGEGVPVQAVGNDQQIVYLLAAYEQIIKHIAPECETFLIIIDQPRNSAGGGYWYVTLAELREHEKRIVAAAQACDADDAELTPGEYQCKWCPAANVAERPGGCPAHAKWLADAIDLDFGDLDEPAETWKPPTVEFLTPERLIRISELKPHIEKMLEYCHAQALQHVLDHGPTAGKKAVAGRRGKRNWANPQAAEAFLSQKLPSADPFNKKLKSPAQAEKEVGKKYEIPTALVEQSQPKPILVPVEDARPAINAIEEEFDEID